MALTPGALGRRYAPFLAVAAVQVLLVAMTPSRPQTVAAGGGPVAATNGNVAAGAVDAAGNPVAIDAAGNPILASGTGTGATGTGAALGVTPSTLPGGRPVPVKFDPTRCDLRTGRQIGWSYYMPPCAAWGGGDNGGVTMTGVTDTEIKYVFFAAKGNAQVNAVLAREGLAASTEQMCQRIKALDAAINKRWEFYGRKMVPLNGPKGTPNDGLQYEASQQANAPNDGGPCRFPYFQSNCEITPPDALCTRAEAQVIAKSLKPAYVMAPVAVSSLFDELPRDGIVVAGGEAEPAAYHAQYPGYYYDVFMDGTRAADMMAEYWCKKLNAKPVKWAGTDVMTDNGRSLTPPIRKLGMLWPENPSDRELYTSSIRRFMDLITGKVKGRGCTDPTEIVTSPYLSDINKAQDQSATTVQKFVDHKVTTVLCVCDPIAPVFLTTNMDANHYYPEHFTSGTGLIDYDVLGRLYTPSEWRNAFGLSHLQVSLPFDQTDATKAWRDAGNTGQPDSTSNLSTAYFTLMASSFQLAGPRPTPANIQQGLFTAPVRGGWLESGGNPAYPKIKFAAPDDFTGINDAREVWWCSSRPSEIDGQPGSYVPVDRGHRYDLGEWPTGDPAVFVGESRCPRAG